MYKLRELKKEDILQINQWRNNPELILGLGAPFRFINPDVDFDWYDSYMRNRDKAVRCVIIDDSDDTHVLGLVCLVGIDMIQRKASFSLMIGDKQNQGKGIGTFATREILKHAFYNLNLHRVELDALETNQAAIGLYKKIGFVQEGIKREASYKNGKYVNLIMMSILKEEFKVNQ